MATTVWSAAWFLPFVLPICLWVAWSDLSSMRIPNVSVIILASIFVVVGPIALPIDIYLIRIVAGLGVLIVGIGLYLIGGIGAGDIKFAAAMAPFLAAGDLPFLTYLFAGTLLASLIVHQIAKRVSFVRNLAPNWKSWDNARFPLGVPLSLTLIFYLVTALMLGTSAG